MTALLPSEIPMNRLAISGLFAPTAAATVFSNFFLHSVYRREGSIANTHAEWVIMVWRKAAVSARKAEDHAERRRPVKQPRGRNRRESAPFDSARRCGCSAGIPRPTFFGLQQRRHRCDRAIGPRQPGFCRSAGVCGHCEIGILLPARQRPLRASAAQVLPSCPQCRRGEGGSARYSADPASPRRFAAGNRALDANRDRASARYRDLQCPGQRSLCRRAKRLGYLLITDDHLPEPLNPLLCFRPLSPSPEIRRALVPKRYAVFTKAADAFLQAAKSLHESDRMPLDSPV